MSSCSGNTSYPRGCSLKRNTLKWLIECFAGLINSCIDFSLQVIIKENEMVFRERRSLWQYSWYIVWLLEGMIKHVWKCLPLCPCPQMCSVISNSTIHCPSHSSSESQQTSVRFFLNGVLYTDESPSSSDSEEEEDEGEDDDPNKDHFLLEYVEDPQFFTANKEKLIKHHPGEPLTLIINVSDATSPGTSCF